MRPIVFLDIDDVLAVHQVHNGYGVCDAFANGTVDAVPELWQNVFDAAACRNLLTLHNEFTPTYVISSSWASFLEREQIDQVLERTGLQFVLNNFHEQWRTPRENLLGRREQIEEWLKLCSLGQDLAYVIIDDPMSGETLRGSRLEDKTVFCDAWVGFTYPKLRTARRILQAQQRNKR